SVSARRAARRLNEERTAGSATSGDRGWRHGAGRRGDRPRPDDDSTDDNYDGEGDDNHAGRNDDLAADGEHDDHLYPAAGAPDLHRDAARGFPRHLDHGAVSGAVPRRR